jgi:hypothetical protein
MKGNVDGYRKQDQAFVRRLKWELGLKCRRMQEMLRIEMRKYPEAAAAPVPRPLEQWQ